MRGIVPDQPSARGSSRLMNSIFASCEIGSARSLTTPSSAIATVRLASDGEMPLAMSSSGDICREFALRAVREGEGDRAGVGLGCDGFEVREAELKSGLVVRHVFLLWLTPANERR